MKHFTKLPRTFGLLSALSLLVVATQAQSVAPYTGQATSGTGGSTYGPLVPTGVTAAVLSGGTRDDGYFNNLPIGFNFNFAGAVYTTFSASTNGWMTFGQALTDAAPFNDLTANFNTTTNLAVRPIVAPLWDDLSFGAATGATNDGNLYYKTTGVAPGRICTIEWRNVRWDATGTSPVVSFIVRLKERSNIVDFTYSQGSSSGSGSRSASVGLGGQALLDYLSAVSLSSSATFSRTMETTNLSSRPTNGRQLVFTPTGLASRSAEALATFQLAPNPATGEVRVLGNDAHLPVQLFDGLGKLVRTLPTTAEILSLRGLPSGTYLVRVGNGSRRLTVE